MPVNTAVEGSFWEEIPLTEDDVRCKLATIDPTLDTSTFAQTVYNQAALSKFKMSMGCMGAEVEEDNDLFQSKPFSHYKCTFFVPKYTIFILKVCIFVQPK